MHVAGEMATHALMPWGKPMIRHFETDLLPERFTPIVFVVLGILTAMLCNAHAGPLPMPAMDGPLTSSSPIEFAAGPLGNLNLTGVLSGLAVWQNNPAPGNQSNWAGISNGQIFIQKTHGLIQFFIQAGAYDIPSLGAPLLSTGRTLTDYYGPLPQAYLKIAPSPDVSILIGKLPTLAGAEYTFTFENMNIQRGLLWNQENAVTRGIQANYQVGSLTASLSLNDGYYSNRFSWLSGELAYALDRANTIAFVGMGNMGSTHYESPATPLYQNNSDLYNLIYSYTSGPWVIQPYLQYSYVPQDVALAISKATETYGAAILGIYRFTSRVFLAVRGEYISSSGNAEDGALNLLYGPGSRAWSVTITPTYQVQDFFARAEFSFVRAVDYAPGAVFGRQGNNPAQARILVESGFFF